MNPVGSTLIIYPESHHLALTCYSLGPISVPPARAILNSPQIDLPSMNPADREAQNILHPLPHVPPGFSISEQETASTQWPARLQSLSSLFFSLISCSTDPIAGSAVLVLVFWLFLEHERTRSWPRLFSLPAGCL